MNTIDDLLRVVCNTITPATFSSRDRKTLISLHNAMKTDTYITEKQGNLLLQILSTPTYSVWLDRIEPNYKSYLQAPQWTKPFRILPDVKKIYYIPADSDNIANFAISKNYTGAIAIEFTFSSSIRNHLKPLLGTIYQVKSGAFYLADFTERNLIAIIKTLEPFNFEVELELQEYYNTIVSWDKLNYEQNFLSENLKFPKFQQLFKNDVGDNVSELILKDRKHRYQYTNHIAGNCNTLTETIAHRPSTKLWINSTIHSLTDVVKSLQELNRLPLLVVFDQSTPFNTLVQFNELSTALTLNGITDNIGIYFRVDNTVEGKIFNDTIAKRQYNANLHNGTKVAGVLGGKLPKFFLKTDWKPMSVLCINNTLRQSKTAVYAKCSDLIITYTPAEPIIEPRNLWE